MAHACGHVDIHKIPSDQDYSLMAYLQYGNNCADIAAKHAAAHDAPAQGMIREFCVQELNSAQLWRLVKL